MNTKEDIELHELESIEQSLNTEAPRDAEPLDGLPAAPNGAFLIT